MGFETSSGTLEKSVDAAIAHAEIHWKKLMDNQENFENRSKIVLTESYDRILFEAFRAYVQNICRAAMSGTHTYCASFESVASSRLETDSGTDPRRRFYSTCRDGLRYVSVGISHDRVQSTLVRKTRKTATSVR